MFLQDNLRAMGRRSEQQEKNLKLANKLVTNSLQTALSYPEYNFEIIPIGVSHRLFRPKDKKKMRQKLGYKFAKIGIFVGEFSEVKGWSKVCRCIQKFPDIFWICVSKKKEKFDAPNVIVYNQISQKKLSDLYNCADFFILGSPVETQCLAAVEACLCNVPVIMKNVGIFRDFSMAERNKVGIFDDDFVKAIQEFNKKQFAPREIILQKKLTIEETTRRWQQLLEQSFLEISIDQITPFRRRIHRLKNFLDKRWRMIKLALVQGFTKWRIMSNPRAFTISVIKKIIPGKVRGWLRKSIARIRLWE
jgi:glycosyltransferase involved in cell wall biosynthesis